MTLKEHGTLKVETDTRAKSSRDVVVSAILVNILNPKLSIFFLAFLPQFIAADAPHPLTAMLELSAIFMAMTFVVFVVYGLFAASLRERVVTKPQVMRWMRRALAGGFALLGARLAFAER
jgi:threonine/homoserine/homoserine lactone efflux protein